MKQKVLVVDDDARVRRLVMATLGTNYHLLEAPNGEQALEVARREQPDLVLLDVLMPGMDGFEVCRRLRADGSLARTKVVMLTALGSEDSRQRGREVGCDDYFAKPFSPRKLLERIDEMLEE